MSKVDELNPVSPHLDGPSGISLRRRRVRGHWLRGVAVISVIGATAFTPRIGAFATAAAPDCPTDFNPYSASDATLTECGDTTIPLAAVGSLSDGGTMHTYATVGTSVSELTPPASFDPQHASPTELAQYGIPAEPPSSDTLAHSLWEAMTSNIHFVEAPQYLVAGPPSLRFTYQIQTQNWSGYYTLEPAQYFHYTWSTFTQPWQLSSGCDPNDQAALWTGLGGGDNSGYIGQQGTIMGYNTGLGRYQAWLEVNLGRVMGINMSSTPAYNFNMATSYGSGKYTFFYYDYYDHNSQSWTSTTSNYDGSSGDFIVERPSSPISGQLDNLSNYGTFPWVLARVAIQENPLTVYPNYELAMNNGTVGDILATASALGSGGDNFTDTQHVCK